MSAYTPEKNTVTMFTTSWCGYCRNLKRGLRNTNITYQEVNIEEHPDAAELVMEFNGGNQTVPTLVFSDGSAVTNPTVEQVQTKLQSIA